MKTSELKNKLRKDNNRRTTVKEEYVVKSREVNKDVSLYNKCKNLKEINTSSNEKETKKTLDDVKIIGVTGSKGKSSVCYIVHEYLKLKGKKSILYSSIILDSKTSIKSKVPLEVPLKSRDTILDILEEAESYNSDYIVLEVNESAIEKGIIDDIEFDVKALTNIIPDCNLERYDSDYYVRLKESFFKNTNDKCVDVIGLNGYFTRESFNKFINLNNNEKITYGTKLTSINKNCDYTNLDILSFNEESSLKGSSFSVRVKNKIYELKNKLIIPTQINNILCSIGILEAIGEFDIEVFNKLFENLNIPGREEVIEVNGRVIVIGLRVSPVLWYLNKYKKNNEYSKLKVVCGAEGVGFKTWDRYLQDEKRVSILDYIYKDIMTCVGANSDYVYITSNDPGAMSASQICLTLQKHLNNKIPSEIVVDRKEAIKKALEESNVGDLIYVVGRGNRKNFCLSEKEMICFTDKEVILETIKKLGWR